jgi:AraC-like DNA-binding protein
MESALPRSQFSTAEMDRAERFSAWREAVSVIYDVSLTEDRAPEAFNAAIDGFLLGPLSQLRVTANEQHFLRSPEQIARDGIDHYMIQIFTGGRCIARSGADEIVMNPGDICVFDQTRPLDSTNEDFDLISLFVPRHLLAEHVSRADDRHHGIVRADDPMACLFRSHVFEIQRNAPFMSVPQGATLVTPTISLLAAALNGDPGSAPESTKAVRTALIGMIKRYIDQNLADPDLDAELIGSVFGISRSRLYRMFDYWDGVAVYIRDRRLMRALVMLSQSMYRERKIIDIAASVGFRSESVFTRAFRRRFGFPPSEARQPEALAFATTAKVRESFTGHEWEQWIRAI